MGLQKQVKNSVSYKYILYKGRFWNKFYQEKSETNFIRTNLGRIVSGRSWTNFVQTNLAQIFNHLRTTLGQI